MSESKTGQTFQVVVNHEEQYSIIPEGKKLPSGWRATGMTGSKADCQRYVNKKK